MKNNKRNKEINDKDYYTFGKLGWCLNLKVTCYGNCTECTLNHFPELSLKKEKEKKLNEN